ncbi:IS3 family transposase [Marinobacter sp. SS5-14b]|uniref:IS3 family transposase n=1 Tax=Marinobacter sp. SS5-14b TaxID=3050456 RepID=UPI0026DFD80A|nr:IS3 family transposase [Marinobacter sp. SS5-14b]
MPRYSEERKAAVLAKLSPPHSMTVAALARQEGISDQTLYNWRTQAREEGRPVPGSKAKSDQWSAEAKLATVIETAALSEEELSQYCREKGLYPEQVRRWKEESLQGFQRSAEREKQLRKKSQSDQKQIKKLERELRHKEKALAETAALLVLRKKLDGALGKRQRGRLTSVPERRVMINLIQEAMSAGARLFKACGEAGIGLRTYRRWFREGEVQPDKRPEAVRPRPANKLSEAERQQILSTCNSARYESLPPSQIVPSLMDEGLYLASESSFYRILKAHNQLNHRGQSLAPQRSREATTHHASGPCEVWCWDITYCASTVRGQFYYLYMFEDVYSRKIVGYEVYETESGDYAAGLLQRCLLREQCLHRPLVLHSDNGAPMKAQTMKAKLEELGVLPSYSRPRVSNDNAFSESLFRTLKYRPGWPSSGFNSLEEARRWVDRFVNWYNHEHKHSKLRFVTPHERHSGEDAAILAQRQRVLEQAKKRTPGRWGRRPIRNCEPVGSTTLNPEKRVVEKDVA